MRVLDLLNDLGNRPAWIIRDGLTYPQRHPGIRFGEHDLRDETWRECGPNGEEWTEAAKRAEGRRVKIERTLRDIAKEVRCPDCKGLGVTFGYYHDPAMGVNESHRCSTCNGHGTLFQRLEAKS